MSSIKSNTLDLERPIISLLREMKTVAERMRALIVAMPPHDLLGYIYAQYLMKAMFGQDSTPLKSESAPPGDVIGDNQFLLEYVHAVLASDHAPEEIIFDEEKCFELFELSRKLKMQAMLYAMATSASTMDGAFGPGTADIEFHAKSTWLILRGNRYQVLEGEFYSYVLTPHDGVLREVYGVGAEEIAIGFQAMADATRSGHACAITEVMKQFDAIQTFAQAEGKSVPEIMEAWVAGNVEQTKAAGLAMDDMLRGGVTNVSRHTNLPPALLADLAYRRGEETEFFAIGDYAGTPYRTLPARKKPLIQLGLDYYAVDPCFTRDAGYRALLYNLLQRKPDYKAIFNERQKVMSESAFADILTLQLPGANVFQEVYYKDPKSNQWSENDTLILIEDVLFLVEAKAGAAATIASPELDFGRHVQSVQDLVVKAYKQCERFFNYLTSAAEVSLYHLTAGKYVECARVRLANYRMLVPIGLTVESFSPFSTFCKELPQIKPLLGKHAFVSLSIDDLFVLKRLLPTPGEFAHYMEVRQAAAGLRGAHLFDEFDHLGAYLKNNRFDLIMADQLKDGKANMVVWDGMSSDIDRCFENENWESGPFPVQEYPQEVHKFLTALDASRASGWLLAESLIRNLSDESRNNLSNILFELCTSLERYPARYFAFGSDLPFFVWLQKSSEETDWQKVNDKASAAALVMNNSHVTGIFVEVTASGKYKAAHTFRINKPLSKNESNAHVFDDAERMRQRTKASATPLSARKAQSPSIGRKPGRNDPCPCQSGLKYKKCHGRQIT